MKDYFEEHSKGAKYTDEVLKKLGISYTLRYDEKILAPIVTVKNSNGDFREYKITMISIYDHNGINNAIDNFIIEMRKEKLIRINKV